MDILCKHTFWLAWSFVIMTVNPLMTVVVASENSTESQNEVTGHKRALAKCSQNSEHAWAVEKFYYFTDRQYRISKQLGQKWEWIPINTQPIFPGRSNQ